MTARRVPHPGHITDAEVEAALDRCCDQTLRAELTGLLQRGTGRPRLLTVEGLLAGLQLCAERHSGAVLLDRTTAILHWSISPGMRERFAIPDRSETARDFEAAYAVVRRLFHRLVKVMDPSVLPKNRRLDKQRAATLEAAADPAARRHQAALLVQVTNSIVEASLTQLRPHLKRYWDGSTGLDATPIRTYAKGVRASGADLASDPDAGWYVRDGDHRDPDTLPAPTPAAHANNSKRTNKPKKKGPGPRKRGTAKYLFGYDATLTVARNPARDGAPRQGGTPDPAAIPAVVTGFVLDKPGTAPGINAIRVLADVRRRQHPAGYLAGDRAYNNCDPNDFQLPARALGYQTVFDYRSDQLGIQAGTAGGAVQIEGRWYCPALPEPLINTTIDLLAATIDKDTWTRRIAARIPYQLVAKQHPDSEGHQRMSCPATAGRLQCPLKPTSLGHDPRLPLADPKPTPAGPDKICAQHSITLPPTAGAQHGQALAYGGSDWQRVYFRLRNSVEHLNGYLKDPACELLESAGRRRIRGIAAQSLLLSFQIAHGNRRKITRWLDTLPGPGRQPKRRPTRRRKTRPLGHWTPAGYSTPVA
jgi:hypothetical protein